jgi:DNA-directed RNA polymerase
MDRTIAMAEKFLEEPAIYFPTQLDFRGRMYPMPSFLNPQGTDCSKALLTFARGCKLGTSGWKWLHIHIANMYGEDKISFDDREAWTVNNYHWILDCTKQPFEHREWMEADKPWQFLAGAIELVAAVESGDYENYFSHLPVTVDGTCNGLQHFSAMLLDEEGARAVNLEPADMPNDIYQIVADKVKEKFATMVDEPMAAAWLAWGFDRKATKRAVMILPYSGTLHAAKDYVRDYVKDREDKAPWDDEFAATLFFSKHVWATIGETIVSAGTVMKWLKQIAKAVTKAGKPIRWVTPINFQVEQDNREMDGYQVDLMLGQSARYQPNMVAPSERLDMAAQRLGISPNFIHSLDANCLMLTVNRALDEGIEDFAMVHDSYGVLAGKMDTLYMGLRQAFVDTYQKDVMKDFLMDATKGLPAKVIAQLLKDMPKKGTFQLERVKESKYFFA